MISNNKNNVSKLSYFDKEWFILNLFSEEKDTFFKDEVYHTIPYHTITDFSILCNCVWTSYSTCYLSELQ